MKFLYFQIFLFNEKLICNVLPILKALLNSKDVSVFLASTELCQKIKDKVLSESFDFEDDNKRSLIPDSLMSRQASKEYGEISRLELINAIISEKLKELKKKDELARIKEQKKAKELERLKMHKKAKISQGKYP